MLTGPERRTEIFVHVCSVIDIEYKRLASVVANFGMLTAISMSHKCTSKNGFGTVYAEISRLDIASACPLPYGKYQGRFLLNPYIPVLLTASQANSCPVPCGIDLLPSHARP